MNGSRSQVRRERGGVRALGRLLTLLLIGVGLAMPSDNPAAASNRASATSVLREAGCPPSRILANTVTEAAREAARQGRFAIFASFETTLAPPVNWRRDDHRSKQWRRALQRLWWLDPLIDDGGGDLQTLRRALDLVMDWVRADRRGKVPDDAWVDKIAGDRAPYLAYVARAAACRGILGRGESRKLVASIRRHGRFLADRVKYRPTNHGLFLDIGLVLLAEQVPSLNESGHWRAVAKSRFQRTLRGRVAPSEGIWREHSVTYQVVATQLAEKFFERLGLSGTPGFLERMREATGWFVMPDGRLAQIGDTDLKDAPAWAAARSEDDRGLRLMKRSGYAVVKEPESYLAVGASFFNGSHKHSDDLSFQLFEGGHRIVSDGGKFHGDFDRTRRFALSSPAHSVLTVDGRSFPREPEQAYGSGILAAGESDGWYAVLARNPSLRAQGVGHTRLILYRPSEVLAVVDRVRATRPHHYQRYFQLGPDIGVANQGTAMGLTAEGFTGALHDARTSRGLARRSAVKGRKRPLRGWTFPSFREWTPRWTLEYESRGEDLDHVATFDLEGSDTTATLLKGAGIGIELRSSTGVTQELTVTRRGSALRIAPGPVGG